MQIIESLFSWLAFALCIPMHYAIHKAIGGGYAKIILILSFLPIDFNRRYKNDTPIELAARCGNLSIVKQLLNIKMIRCNNSYNIINALCEASKCGHVLVVFELLKIKIVRDKADFRGNYALNNAVCNGHLSIAQELLKNSAVKNRLAAKNNILKLAVMSSNFVMAEALLKTELVRDNAHYENNAALYKAVCKWSFPLVDALLKLPNVRHLIAMDANHDFFKKISNRHPAMVYVIVKAMWSNDFSASRAVKTLLQPKLRMAIDIKVQLALEFKSFKRLDNLALIDSLTLASSPEALHGNTEALPFDIIGHILQYLYEPKYKNSNPIVLMFMYHISHKCSHPELYNLAFEAADSVLAIEDRKSALTLSHVL